MDIQTLQRLRDLGFAGGIIATLTALYLLGKFLKTNKLIPFGGKANGEKAKLEADLERAEEQIATSDRNMLRGLVKQNQKIASCVEEINTRTKERLEQDIEQRVKIEQDRKIFTEIEHLLSDVVSMLKLNEQKMNLILNKVIK